jgi:hypothetical protein
MSDKRVPIGSRPVADPEAESWVRQGDGANRAAAGPRANLYTARLTIDVTPALRGRIKIAAFRQGMTVADMVRAMLEREYPGEESGG